MFAGDAIVHQTLVLVSGHLRLQSRRGRCSDRQRILGIGDTIVQWIRRRASGFIRFEKIGLPVPDYRQQWK
jgi:hypothetical protein